MGRSRCSRWPDIRRKKALQHEPLRLTQTLVAALRSRSTASEPPPKSCRTQCSSGAEYACRRTHCERPRARARRRIGHLSAGLNVIRTACFRHSLISASGRGSAAAGRGSYKAAFGAWRATERPLISEPSLEDVSGSRCLYYSARSQEVASQELKEVRPLSSNSICNPEVDTAC
jgi:hypothetical protein